MSPRPRALKPDIVEMENPTVLENSSDAEAEDRLQTSEAGRRKLTAAKAAATGLEKDKDNSTASSSGGEAAMNPVDRPRQQEATVGEAKTLNGEGEGLSKFETRTDQELKERVEDLRRTRELEELKKLHEKLENSAAEMEKLRDDSEKGRKKMKE